ncbi:MAG: glycosyltransferase [Elainellaceae cyanobacterium]
MKQQKNHLLGQLSKQQQEFQEEKQALIGLRDSAHQTASLKLQAELESAEAELESTKAELESAEAKFERELLSLQEKLHELDRSRARIIDQLNNERSQLNSYNAHLLQQLEVEKTKIRQLENQVQNKTKQIARVRQNACQQTEFLNAEIARLQVGRVALQQVLKSLLRRLGLYSAVKAIANSSKESKALESALTVEAEESQPKSADPAARSPRIEQSRLDSVKQAITPDQAIQTDRVNAVVIARSLGIDVIRDASALETIEQLISKPTSVLCLNPNRQMIPLLQRLASSGGKLVCIDDGLADDRFGSGGLAAELTSYRLAVQPNLADWLGSLELPMSSWCNLLCIDAAIAPVNQRLLQGRLAPNTPLLVFQSGPIAGQQVPQHRSPQRELLELGVPAAQLGPLSYYPSPPARWIDPLYLSEPQPQQGRRWPWNYPVAPLPNVMPSGRPWPKISIVTVSFNHGQFIEETIRSVLGQGYPNLEYIIIDGGSTDETSSILRWYDSELSYWISESDSGQSNALNKGFCRATGDIFAWLNSDDRYLPHTLARVAIAFDTYQTDMVVGGCQLVQDYQDSPFKTHRSKFPVGQVVPLPLEDLLDIENCWHQGEFFYQPEVFWTQDLWQRAGGQLDETLFYSMDYDLWVRMAQQGAALVHSSDALALYRVHSDQKTFGDDVPYMPELKGVSDRYRK